MLVFAPHGALACAVAGCLFGAGVLDQEAPGSAAPQTAETGIQSTVPAPAPSQVQTPTAQPDSTSESLLDPDSPLAEMPDLGVAWPDLSQPTDGTPVAATTADTAALRRYTYRVDGIGTIEDSLFRTRFDALSSLRTHQGDPANAAQIDRRAREDADLLTTLLRGLGYYDARVATSVETRDGAPEVVLDANPGQLYKFAAVRLNGIEEAGTRSSALKDSFGIADGAPVNADTIATAEESLKAAIGKEGFPFGEIGQSAIVVDHASRSATLDLSVEPGTARNFGQVVTPPNRLFSARHIQQVARFKPGQPFDAAQLDDLRRALIQTSLVSSVTIKPIEGKVPGTVDIDVRVEPAPPHTISGELGYGTGEGVRAEISWAHRNLFPPEGGLTLRGVLGTQEQSGGVIFRRNNFEGRDRVLTGQLTASNVKRAAYQATGVTLSGSLERQTNIFFQKAWTWSLGAELVATDERDVIVSTGAPRRRTYFIGALPTTLNYDGTDDLLNPTRGFRIGSRISPEVSLQGQAFGYVRVQLDTSAYKTVNDKLVLAGRVRLGTIVGAPRDQIAPSRRFYAGGGASVRGYGYQAIGPRDPNNDPVGGRSLSEFSVEARVKAFGNFGVVPFLDGGNVSTAALPSFEKLQYGAGLGVRYYSNFGPIRIDVGTPINPQPGDPRIAVYVSLGQAF